jgi:hypothetical protein
MYAANAPDADVAILLADRWSPSLPAHHSFTAGTLAIALLLPLIFWLGDRGLMIRSRPPSARLKASLASLIVSATHPLLD